ncbi:MAG: tryptophan synthase subunit alpha [Endomicrobiales bacterium]|jgi:tryptophan synthase alpha chain
MDKNNRLPNRLRHTVGELKAHGTKALVAYVTGGFPDLKYTEQVVPHLAENGVDIIEIGVPFSDPVADGPTIQNASEYALKKGVGLADIFSAVRRIRAKTDVPIVLMTYMNPVYHYGYEKAARTAAAAGVDGFIVPDSIPDESAEFRAACIRHGISLVYLVAPTTPPERMRYIDRCSDSFVYIVSLIGVTGGRKTNADGVTAFLEVTKKNIAHARFVGFGISGPDQISRLKIHGDGFIVGSALIDIIRTTSGAQRAKRVGTFIRSLRRALDTPNNT